MNTTPPKDEDGADASVTSVLNGNCEWMADRRRPLVNGLAKTVVLTGMDSRTPPLEMLGQRSQNTAMST